MQTLVRLTAVLLLVLSLGLHWAFLQTVAWSGMIINYSRADSFKAALTKTFDGKHPCGLCKAVQQGQAEEKRQEQQQVKAGSKLELGPVWQAVVFHFRCVCEPIFAAHSSAPARSYEPPKPRPRGISSNSLV